MRPAHITMKRDEETLDHAIYSLIYLKHMIPLLLYSYFETLISYSMHCFECSEKCNRHSLTGASLYS